ncbi:MAG: hypothetical protein M0D53_02580 [Flavobacterium sp. JAD_PAG50586_2]|nr:MAG: hypothetical protein M0D53_02580 [Flavobacterium sp. JAD_PAG50586_2]
MNKSIFSIAFLLLGYVGFSQTYEFHTVKEIEAMPVISQGNTEPAGVLLPPLSWKLKSSA